MSTAEPTLPRGLRDFANDDPRILHLPVGEGDIFYHGTTQAALHFIRREGLLPRYEVEGRGRPFYWSRRNGVFVCREPQLALRFAKAAARDSRGLPALLRLSLEGLELIADPAQDLRPFSSYLAEKAIAPERIRKIWRVGMSADLAAVLKAKEGVPRLEQRKLRW